MVPVTNIDALTVLGIVASSVVGTGALTFFVRYGTRLALIEKTIDTSQLVTLHPRVNRVEDAIFEIKTLVSKLNLLDVLTSRLDTMTEVMRTAVPRTELEVHWKSLDERFDTIEAKLDRSVAMSVRQEDRETHKGN
jgi:hypothetical protein